MKTLMKSTSALFIAALVGCVVIPDTFEAHITIDIRHIEEQADEFLDYVEGKSDALPDFDAAPADQNSSLRTLGTHFAALWTPRVAHAAALNDSSPRVKQIADSMKRRYPELRAAKSTGGVGENNRGHVEIVDTSVFSSSEAQNEAQRLVAAENEDRRALYKEIVRLNADQGVTVSAIEGVYAMKHLERAASGDRVQLPPPGENFDKVKNGSIGQALGSQCTPGAWVRKP